MKVQSKKDSFFIHTKRKPTNVIKVSNYYDSKRNYSAEWEFVIIKNGLISDVDDNYCDRNLPIISFEEWQSLPDFPKPEYDPKDVAFNQRPVIGYKFKNKDLLETFKSIYYGFVPWCDTFDLLPDNTLKRNLENLGVIELWFKPVYEKETITLKSGVKLSEDDIAEVKEILNNK